MLKLNLRKTLKLKEHTKTLIAYFSKHLIETYYNAKCGRGQAKLLFKAVMVFRTLYPEGCNLTPKHMFYLLEKKSFFVITFIIHKLLSASILSFLNFMAHA